jgi:hypothetical protein
MESALRVPILYHTACNEISLLALGNTLSERCNIFPPSKLARSVTLLTCTRMLAWTYTILTEVFRVFLRFVQVNTGIILYVRPQPLRFTSFPIHYSRSSNHSTLYILNKMNHDICLHKFVYVAGDSYFFLLIM